LLGGAAHELNNIFAQTLLLAEVLGSADIDSDLKSMLGSLQTSVQRGIQVVSRLVEHSYVPRGEDLRFDPRHLISAVHKRSGGLVGENVVVSHRYPERVPDIEVEPQAVLEGLLQLCRATAEELPGRGLEPRLDVIIATETDDHGRDLVLLGATAPPSVVEGGRLAIGEDVDLSQHLGQPGAELLVSFSNTARELGARACVRKDGRGVFLALLFDAAE
jgi:hypothetical protein